LFAKWLVNFEQRNIYNSLIYLKVAFVVDILNALNEDLDINKLIIEERQREGFQIFFSHKKLKLN
jgi:hypothetical protein